MTHSDKVNLMANAIIDNAYCNIIDAITEPHMEVILCRFCESSNWRSAKAICHDDDCPVLIAQELLDNS